MQIAAIVELIHIATLLHDDVIDESHQRRGRRTVNSLYGNEAAVISGDFLFGRVFRMCAELTDRTSAKSSPIPAFVSVRANLSRISIAETGSFPRPTTSALLPKKVHHF